MKFAHLSILVLLTTSAFALPPQDTVSYRNITQVNRRQYQAMFGGWGEHLRSILTDSTGKRWMVLDTGSNVLVNPALAYSTFDGQSWNVVARLPLPATIQQNMATVLSGRFLYSYGVNVGAHYVTECYLDTLQPQRRACNAITVSGSVYRTPPNTNYIGAAVSPTGLRLVWWTQVGDNGGGGKFWYTYNSGGGWNGPYQITLGGYSDLEYVYASFKNPHEVAIAGQLFVGLYPGGRYAAGYAQFRLGNQAAITTPFRPAGNSGTVAAATDVWVNPADASVHVMARTLSGTVTYYYKPWAESWATHHDPLWAVGESLRARFLPSSGHEMRILIGRIGSSPGLLARVFRGPEVDRPLQWGAFPFTNYPLGGIGLQSASALYVPSASYQTTPVGAPRFGICGQAWGKDNEIWEGEIH